MVGQDPAASFVTDTVEDELAYTMENLGLAPASCAAGWRTPSTCSGLHELRHRPLATLSGGQQQRVAIGAVLTASPRVLVLDEPTSALDPAAAEEVLASLTRLVHDLGLTVLLAEHRLERVVPFADSVVLVPGRRRVRWRSGRPAEVMVDAPGGAAPGRARPAGRLGAAAAVGARRPPAGRAAARAPGRFRAATGGTDRPASDAGAVARLANGWPSATARSRPSTRVDLDVRGRRGGGGHGPQRLGQVDAAGPAGRAPRRRRRAGSDVARRRSRRPGPAGPDPARVGLVPQDPACSSTATRWAPSATAPTTTPVSRRARRPPCSTGSLPGLPRDRHPRDLSEGQRLALALAVVLAPAPPLILLDEPTRGLDYPGKDRLVGCWRAGRRRARWW